MIDKKIIITSNGDYESMYLVHTFQECDDCGSRHYAENLVRFKIKHKYPLLREGSGERIKIPIDANHFVNVQFYRAEVIDHKINTVVSDLRGGVNMHEVTSRDTLPSKMWSGRNAIDIQLFEGLGTDTISTCNECYDEDYRDDEGDNYRGTDIMDSSVYFTIVSHSNNTIDMSKITRQPGGVYYDIPRSISCNDDNFKAMIGNMSIELDIIQDMDEGEEPWEYPRFTKLAEYDYGNFFDNLLRTREYSFKRFSTKGEPVAPRPSIAGEFIGV